MSFEFTYASQFGYKLEKRDGDAGYDLYTPVDIFLPPGCEMVVDTGIRIKIPQVHGHVFTMAVPRSSAGVKKGLMIKNTVGIIDPSYCGELDSIKLVLRRMHPSNGTYLGYLTEDEHGNKIIHRGGNHVEKYSVYNHYCVQDTEAEEIRVFQAAQPKESDLLYRAGDRFAQLLFLPFKSLEGKLVMEMEDKSRGGFGSTGQ